MITADLRLPITRDFWFIKNDIVVRELVHPVDPVGLHFRPITCKTTEELGWYIKRKQLGRKEMMRHLFGRELVLQEPPACVLVFYVAYPHGSHFYLLAHEVVHNTEGTNSSSGQAN